MKTWIKWWMCVGVLAIALHCAGANAATSSPKASRESQALHHIGADTVIAAEAQKVPVPKEPAWGRIYLRHGVAPIQYFRDNYGGPMVAHEVEFYFPAMHEHRHGCQLLPTVEQDHLQAANGSMVLVLDRGECSFEIKSRNAQAMGAVGVIVVSLTDDVRGPAAIIDEHETDAITIPSVMIRRSAGTLLHTAAEHGRLFGWLMPMICERKPYKCVPRSEPESEYIAKQTTRSGVIFAGRYDDHVTVGNFVAATYGSVFSANLLLPLAKPLVASHDVAKVCDAHLPNNYFEGKVVTIHTEGACSELDRVTNAQHAGASAVLLVMAENATIMSRPTVEKPWYGYNITLPVAVISRETEAALEDLFNTDPTAKLLFRGDNSIADTWDWLQKLTERSGWPKRNDRRERLVKRMLRTLAMDESQIMTLQHLFLTIAEGSVESWKQASEPSQLDQAENGKDVVTTGEAKILENTLVYTKDIGREEL